MLKSKIFVLAIMLCFILMVSGDAFCMGWFRPPPANPVDPGPVSAPEPGVITLIGIAAGAGVGYFFGKRKK